MTAKKKAELRVGTCSWTDPTLIASGWYPEPIKDDADRRLRYYAERFPIVENDAAYYALPSQKQAQLWAERTPDGFVMNFKAFATLTTHHTDPKRFPSSIPPVAAVTNPELAIVRFHGRNAENWKKPGLTAAERFDYSYRKPELEEWLPKIREMAEQAREMHLLMNNCYGDKAVNNAAELAKLLE